MASFAPMSTTSADLEELKQQRQVEGGARESKRPAGEARGKQRKPKASPVRQDLPVNAVSEDQARAAEQKDELRLEDRAVPTAAPARAHPDALDTGAVTGTATQEEKPATPVAAVRPQAPIRPQESTSTPSRREDSAAAQRVEAQPAAPETPTLGKQSTAPEATPLASDTASSTAATDKAVFESKPATPCSTTTHPPEAAIETTQDIVATDILQPTVAAPPPCTPPATDAGGTGGAAVSAVDGVQGGTGCSSEPQIGLPRWMVLVAQTTKATAFAMANLVASPFVQVTERYYSAKVTVVSAWATANEKGAKLFVADTVEVARKTVTEYANLSRAQVTDRYQQVSAKTSEGYVAAKVRAVETSQHAKDTASAAYNGASARTALAVKFSQAKGQELQADVKDIVTDTKFQVTAGSAAGGAVAGGVGGGAVGLTTGAAIGTAVGLVPAIFTFGLSIPVGAVVGGGAGLLFGTAAGATTGAIGGGATGRVVYSKKDDIASGASVCAEYVKGKAGSVKDQACASAEFFKEKACRVSTRFVGGTGGTEANSE